VALLLWPGAASGAVASGPVDPGPAPAGGVVVRFKSGVDAGERAQARDAADVRRDQGLPVAGMEVVKPEAGVSVQASVAALERSDDVAYAEPDVRRTAFASPDDTFFGLEWGLSNGGQTVGGTSGTLDADIDADQAWDTTVGSSDVVVGSSTPAWTSAIPTSPPTCGPTRVRAARGARATAPTTTATG
jgi:hypothetical protein